MSNTEKEFTCLQPTYVKYFKCEGDICNARCCKGFQVDIDRTTHEKYKSITDKHIRSTILNSLVWNKPSSTYRMYLKEGAVCPMLQPDCLCYIQKNFGHDFLSDVCADYPRRTFVIDDLVLRSMALTCPIAARLALLNPEPMTFEQSTFKTTRSGSFFYRSVNSVPNRKHLSTLMTFSGTILKDRRLTINQRLAALGFVLSEADGLIAIGREADLKLIDPIYHTDNYFNQLLTKIHSLKFNRQAYLNIMFALIDRIFPKGVTYYSPNQRHFAKYPLMAFDFVDKHDKKLAELFALYDKNVGIYKKIAHDPFNHVLENYLMHSFFAGIYPCHVQGTLMINYFLFLTLYKFFEFGLMSMAAVMNERFSIYDLLELAERFCNRVDHSNVFAQATLDYIVKPQQWPLELMQSLIDFEV